MRLPCLTSKQNQFGKERLKENHPAGLIIFSFHLLCLMEMRAGVERESEGEAKGKETGKETKRGRDKGGLASASRQLSPA